MLAIERPSHAIERPSHAIVATTKGVHHVATAKPTALKLAMEALDGLQASMDVMLVKLSASNTPGYLHCVSISVTSHTLASSLQRAATLAAAAQAEASPDEARRILAHCHSQFASRSQQIDGRLRVLRPHFERLGVMPLVRRDLQAGFNAAQVFLGAALANLSDDLREDARVLVGEVMHSTTSVLAEYGL